MKETTSVRTISGNNEMMCGMMMCAMRNIMAMHALLYCHSGKSITIS